jgi:hypothetical protein
LGGTRFNGEKLFRERSMSMQIGELALNELKVKIKQLECNRKKSPDTHENLHSQKPESFSESNGTNYFHNSQLEINRKSIHEINNANQNVMRGLFFLLHSSCFILN